VNSLRYFFPAQNRGQTPQILLLCGLGSLQQPMAQLRQFRQERFYLSPGHRAGINLRLQEDRSGNIGAAFQAIFFASSGKLE
jgi:hypothetical protein